MLFIYTANNRKCAQDWHKSIDRLVSIYKAAGVHVFLVPSVPFVRGSPRGAQLAHGQLDEASYYQALAVSDPTNITVLDAGVYVRDASGVYQWRMPCIAGGEAGCDAQNTVGVRFVDGLHFCTDPDFAADGCVGDEFKAGERRVAIVAVDGRAIVERDDVDRGAGARERRLREELVDRFLQDLASVGRCAGGSGEGNERGNEHRGPADDPAALLFYWGQT